MKLKKLFKQIKETEVTKVLPYDAKDNTDNIDIDIEIRIKSKGKWLKNAIIENVIIEKSGWRDFE